MKTVMKKMFCLMLVAVMLVGVMPFAAFADEISYFDLAVGEHILDDALAKSHYEGSGTPTEYYVNINGVEYQKGDTIVVNGETVRAALVVTAVASGHEHSYTETITIAATCTTAGVKTFTCGCGDTYTAPINALGHDFGEWVVTTPASCSATGVETRTCSRNDAEETRDVAIDPDAHDFSSKGVCNDCKLCKHCNMKDAHKTNCIYYCNGTTSCPNDPAAANAHNEGCLKTKCNKNGCTLAYNHTGECSVPCTKTPGCVLNQGHTGECDTPCTFAGCTKGYNHTGDHSNACATCGLPLMKSPEHKASCSYYYLNEEPSNTGNALVRVHVRLFNANTHIDTVELLTYRDDMGTQIGDSVSAHKSLIYAELADQYPDYTWGGNLYDDPGESQDYNEQIGEGTTVYINAYANQDMVLIYVHNSRSFNNLRIIQLEGKRKGDTVTKKEVTNAVSKYYNVSSLSMYSEDAWEAYVDGENVESVSSLKIPEDDSYYVIDVKISGTAKSGTSSSSTADSSNPKTGDEIFAPVAILGASASALAVLFYLNKKRAY